MRNMRQFEMEVLQYTNIPLVALRHIPIPKEGGLPHTLLSVGSRYLCLSDEWPGWNEPDPWDTNIPISVNDYEWYNLE